MSNGKPKRWNGTSWEEYEFNNHNLGTAAKSNVETTGVASNTTTLPTTAQVKSYVDGIVGDIDTLLGTIVNEN